MSLEIDFKNQWNLETALEIAQHPTVDAKLWSEAIEWLLLYGPPEIKHMLLQASEHATAKEFPELKPTHYTPDGLPVYNIEKIAASLGLNEEETRKIIAEKESRHKTRHFVEVDGELHRVN